MEMRIISSVIKSNILSIILIVIILGCSVFPEAKLQKTDNAVADIVISDVTTNSLVINWQSVADAEQYEIYRSNKISGEYALIATVDSSKTNYKDENLTSGSNYYYKIKVVNKYGTSDFSNYISGLTYGVFFTVSAPELTIDTVTSYGVKLKWNKINGAYFYKIHKTSLSGDYLDTRYLYGETEMIDLSLEKDKTYFYQISSVNFNYQESTISEKISVTLGDDTDSEQIPSAPKNVRFENIKSYCFNLYWDFDDKAISYRVALTSSLEEMNGLLSNSQNIRQHSYSPIWFDGLSPSTTYFVRIASENIYGISDFSSIITVETTEAVTSPIVTDFTWKKQPKIDSSYYDYYSANIQWSLYHANDTIGLGYYVLLPEGSQSPSTSEIISGTGKNGVTAISSGRDVSYAVQLNDLSPNTVYDFYIFCKEYENFIVDGVQKDTGRITDVYKLTFTTKTPPYISPEVQSETITFRYQEIGRSNQLKISVIGTFNDWGVWSDTNKEEDWIMTMVTVEEYYLLKNSSIIPDGSKYLLKLEYADNPDILWSSIDCVNPEYYNFVYDQWGNSQTQSVVRY